MWLEYCLPAQRGAVTLARYTLTSASDCADNDPMVVILCGVRTTGCTPLCLLVYASCIISSAANPLTADTAFCKAACREQLGDNAEVNMLAHC